MLCKCDGCGKVSDFRLVTQNFIHDDERYVVDFLLCPICKHVDVVTIKDKKAFNLSNDLNKSLERLSKLVDSGKTNTRAFKLLQKSIKAKSERFSKQIDDLRSKFHGVFTVEDTKLSDGTITDVLVYHETVK